MNIQFVAIMSWSSSKSLPSSLSTSLFQSNHIDDDCSQRKSSFLIRDILSTHNTNNNNNNDTNQDAKDVFDWILNSQNHNNNNLNGNNNLEPTSWQNHLAYMWNHLSSTTTTATNKSKSLKDLILKNNDDEPQQQPSPQQASQMDDNQLQTRLYQNLYYYAIQQQIIYNNRQASLASSSSSSSSSKTSLTTNTILSKSNEISTNKKKVIPLTQSNPTTITTATIISKNNINSNIKPISKTKKKRSKCQFKNKITKRIKINNKINIINHNSNNKNNLNNQNDDGNSSNSNNNNSLAMIMNMSNDLLRKDIHNNNNIVKQNDRVCTQTEGLSTSFDGHQSCIDSNSSSISNGNNTNSKNYHRDLKFPKIRRNRTVFTELQLMGLERRFDSQKYLSTPDRTDLARALGLTQLQVKTWYQNRRMKWKKQVMQNGCPFPPTKPKGRPKKDSIPTYGLEFTNSILCPLMASVGQSNLIDDEDDEDDNEDESFNESIET